MASKRNDVYRGKHKRRSMIGGIVFLLVLLVTAAVVMFYGFQKYIVYGQDGVSLELPILAGPEHLDESGQVTRFAEVDTELVVEQPDYSGIEATAGAELTDLAALFIPAEHMNAEAIAKYVAVMPSYGATGLVMELKPVSGQLVYPSAVDMATSYGLSGAFDLTETIAALKQQGIYLVAQLSCCVDNLLATRNSPIALKNSFGSIYTDTTGSWLDPYNAQVRQYISDLSLELAEMGFDEILLKYVEMPITDEALSYSVQLSFTPTPAIGVSGFALKVTRDLSGSGARVSALISYDSLSAGKGDVSGQDLTLFVKVFDRLCCWAGTSWEHGMYRDAISGSVTVGSVAQRFLPIMSFVPDGSTSFIVLVPAGLLA